MHEHTQSKAGSQSAACEPDIHQWRAVNPARTGRHECDGYRAAVLLKGKGAWACSYNHMVTILPSNVHFWLQRSTINCHSGRTVLICQNGDQDCFTGSTIIRDIPGSRWHVLTYLSRVDDLTSWNSVSACRPCSSLTSSSKPPRGSGLLNRLIRPTLQHGRMSLQIHKRQAVLNHCQADTQ